MKKQNRPRPRRPFVATWWVAKDGYRWVQAFQTLDKAQLDTDIEGETSFFTFEKDEHDYDDEAGFYWIVADAPPSHEFPDLDVDWYDPLAEVGLHRAFASVKPEVASILSFVQKYGFLGRTVLKVQPDPQVDQFQWGEGINDWLAQLFRMKVLLLLWDLYRADSEEATNELEELLHFGASSASVSDSLAIGEKIGFPIEDHLRTMEGGLYTPDFDPGLDHEVSLERLPLAASARDAVRPAARLLIREAVNECLSEGCVPAIDIRPGAPFSVIPRDLLGALYVHFALELNGQTPPTIQCPGCGRWFHPEHGSQIHCDDRCKFRAYRQRKKTGEQTNAKKS